MERIVTPPVLVTVMDTMGIGQYGGGSDGNLAGDGSICNRAAVANVVVDRGAVVAGGRVVGVVVGVVSFVVDGTAGDVLGEVLADGVQAVAGVADTGWTVVVVSGGRRREAAGCCAPVDEATTRAVLWPTKASAVTPASPSTVSTSTTTTPNRRGCAPYGIGCVSG